MKELDINIILSLYSQGMAKLKLRKILFSIKHSYLFGSLY